MPSELSNKAYPIEHATLVAPLAWAAKGARIRAMGTQQRKRVTHSFYVIERGSKWAGIAGAWVVPALEFISFTTPLQLSIIMRRINFSPMKPL